MKFDRLASNLAFALALIVYSRLRDKRDDASARRAALKLRYGKDSQFDEGFYRRAIRKEFSGG